MTTTPPISGMDRLSIVENVARMEEPLPSTTGSSHPSFPSDADQLNDLRAAADRIDRLCNHNLNESSLVQLMDEFVK